MTGRLGVPVTRPIRGVRLHAMPAAAVTPAPALARLFDLRDRARNESERRAELERVLGALDDAVRGLPATVVDRLDAIAEQVAELALAVAGEIVGDALERGLVDPTPIVARCLRDATDGSQTAQLHVYLSPDDHALVLSSIGDDPELQRRTAGVSFTPENGLGRGCVRVESGVGRLLYDPLEVYGRIADEIRKGCEP